MTPAEVLERAMEAAIRAYDDEGSGYPVWHAGIRAAIDAYERAMWRPISEAPRDGTEVLAAFKGQFRWIVFKAHCGAHGLSAPGHAPPTHWRPLPVGPGDAP